MLSRGPIGRGVRGHHRAFTLLEVVVAVGLSLLLMIALWSAVDLYRHVSTSGRGQVERAQLARAILRILERDIRASTFVATDDDSEDTSSAESTQEGESTVVVSVDPAEALFGQSIGIVGDANALFLHVSRPQTDWAWLPPTAIAPSGTAPSDLKLVAYYLADPGSDESSGGPIELPGLARVEGDQASLALAEASGDLQMLLAQAELLAHEVNLLQFRYFDGQYWYEAWDSNEYARLPNAVEITIGFRDATPVGTSSADADSSSRQYRYVVDLPTAEPNLLDEPLPAVDVSMQLVAGNDE